VTGKGERRRRENGKGNRGKRGKGKGLGKGEGVKENKERRESKIKNRKGQRGTGIERVGKKCGPQGERWKEIRKGRRGADRRKIQDKHSNSNQTSKFWVDNPLTQCCINISLSFLQELFLIQGCFDFKVKNFKA
jgi:hypothetical protein